MTAFDPIRLTARGLAARRGLRLVFEGLDVDLGPGEALELRGPNGTGKTTLLRALAGFMALEAGGIQLTANDDAVVEREHAIGWLGHENALKARETPGEHLRFASTWLGSDAETLTSAIKRWGLVGFLDRPAYRLSAGQRRRTALARLAIAPRPLWLLDEPAAALDTDAIKTLAAQIGEHRARGGMIIAATHQPLGWPDTVQLELGS